MADDNLAKRVAAAIEANFDDCIKEAAHAEWMRLSGNDDNEDEFLAHVQKIVDMRKRQLAAIEGLKL